MARLARGLPQKQDGIKIVTKIPSGADGKAGDMRLLAKSSVTGAVLYVKSGNKWFPFQSGIDTSTPAKKLFEEDGYQYFDSGLIIQWGNDSRNTDAAYTINFTKEFPSECVGVMVNRQTADAESPMLAISYTKTGFTIDRDDGITGSQTINYLAIGH